MTTYALAYDAYAVNVDPATLAAAMAAVPLETDPFTVLGLSVSSDITSVAALTVTRTITLASSTGPLPNNQIAPVLANYMTATLGQALATPVTAEPVIVV